MAKKEKLTILIDPDNGEYEMSIDYVRISHIRQVCSDIVERIDKGELHRPDLIVDEEEELPDEEDLLNGID